MLGHQSDSNEGKEGLYRWVARSSLKVRWPLAVVQQKAISAMCTLAELTGAPIGRRCSHSFVGSRSSSRSGRHCRDRQLFKQLASRHHDNDDDYDRGPTIEYSHRHQ